jgi:hypothetical protein
MKKMLFLSLVVSSLLGNANFASANEDSSVDQSFNENGVLFLKKGDQEIVLIKKSDSSKQQALKLSQEEGFHVVDVTNRRSWRTFFKQVWNSKAWSAWELKAVGLLNMEKVLPGIGYLVGDMGNQVEDMVNQVVGIVGEKSLDRKTIAKIDSCVRNFRDKTFFVESKMSSISIDGVIDKIFGRKSFTMVWYHARSIYKKTRDLFHIYAGIALFVKLSYSVMSQEGKTEGLSLETQSALKKQLSKVAFIVNESDFAAVSKALTEK